MTGSTKNQHYVPKFYLKKFSFELNEKEIGLYNLNNKKFIRKAPLKSQASKDFFYGRDGELETWLSNIEGKLARTIKNILQLKKPLDEGDFYDLITFVVLTSHRNPVTIENSKSISKTFDDVIKEISPDIEYEKVPNLGHDFAIKTSLDNLSDSINYCLDLKYKILVNRTKLPFIVSDNPVIKYNQFLESRKWAHGKTGWASIGLQLIVPLSPWIAVCLYDGSFYKLGKYKEFKINITDYNDISQLNLLQFINCSSTCYFNDLISSSYIENLCNKSSSYPKANISKYLIHKGIDDNNREFELVQVLSSDCEINLKCDWIKYTSGALNYVLGDRLVYLRPHCSKVRAAIKLRDDFDGDKSSYTIRKK